MDLFPKFIIQGENLILSKVTFHKDLVLNGNGDIKGGGFFKLDFQSNTFILYKATLYKYSI